MDVKAPSVFVSPSVSASHVISGEPVTEMFSLSLSRSSSSFDDEISVIFVLPASGELFGLLVLVGNFVWPAIGLSAKWEKQRPWKRLNNFNDATKINNSRVESSREIIDTYFHLKRVAPSDRWQPGRCALRSADDDGNTATVEKVDYLKHASLVYPLSELGMSVFRVDDVGSLCGLNVNKQEKSSNMLLESSVWKNR